MTQKQVLETLKKLKNDAEKRYNAKLKGIFGSYASGEFREDSDIDILVEFKKGATLLDLAGLGNFLEEKLKRKIDLVSERAIREELRPYIHKDIVYL